MPMAETSISLLERLRLQPDSAAWQRLVAGYPPLIRGWLHRDRLPEGGGSERAQSVLAVPSPELPHCRHDLRTGAFRRWLRTITVNRLRSFWRARAARPVATGDSAFANMLDQLEDPDSGLSRLWDEEHDRHVAHRLL